MYKGEPKTGPYTATFKDLLCLQSCKISDERMALSFTIAADRRQRSHSRVRVQRDSRPYFTVQILSKTFTTWTARIPYLYPTGTGWLIYTIIHWVSFSSAPLTRWATVEFFEPHGGVLAPTLWSHIVACRPVTG
jgi:hypothetical protein